MSTRVEPDDIHLVALVRTIDEILSRGCNPKVGRLKTDKAYLRLLPSNVDPENPKLFPQVIILSTLCTAVNQR
jgi:hypothetical protein